ncbi:hypothetical protein [Nocardioides sp.]|uniref:hypothetical protein n=1 Tax=Nocardioides sp. TaxID=35761 RepID=UPI0039E22766
MYNKNDVQIRTGPSNTTAAVGWGQKSHDVCLLFYVTGQTIAGNSTWWYTRNYNLGVYGYSPAARITPITIVSSC